MSAAVTASQCGASSPVSQPAKNDGTPARKPGSGRIALAVEGGVDDGSGRTKEPHATRVKPTGESLQAGADCDAAAADATPSQVWWLCSQHQPRCGAFSEIHSAGTRLSVPREAAVWKHLFFSRAAGTACRKASPSSMVSMRPAAARDATAAASAGRTPQNSSPRSTPTHGVHRRVGDVDDRREGVHVGEVPAERARRAAEPQHRHPGGDRHQRCGRDQHERRCAGRRVDGDRGAEPGPQRVERGPARPPSARESG